MIRAHSRKIGTFLYVWLTVGFASGTLVLLGPSRWLTHFVRARGWTQARENFLMWGVIGLYVAMSFVLALWITQYLLQYRARAAKAGVFSVVTGVALLALWGWSNPALYAGAAGGAESSLALSSGARFIFGPYPDRERLEQLKAEGITGVISLQHPAVVPFEPEGIEHERAWTDELGIRFVNAPMLPWVSDNREALAQVETIVREGRGVWYVHCGLGRDRVNVVRNMIEREVGAARLVRNDAPKPLTWGDRVAEGLGPMERGTPVELSPDVWLVPFPNQHELYGHMLAGQVRSVVLVLDPNVPEERQMIAEVRKLLLDAGARVFVSPLSLSDPSGPNRIANEVAAMVPPTTVIVPRTWPQPNAELAQAIEAAWKAGIGERGGRSSGARAQ